MVTAKSLYVLPAVAFLIGCSSTARFSSLSEQDKRTTASVPVRAHDTKQTPAEEKRAVPATVESSMLPMPDLLPKRSSFRQTGMASYYAHKFHGRRTASGERYNKAELTAAHPRLPFGTHVKVTNLANHRSVIVRINDRGPHTKKRIIDLSYAAAKKIKLISSGTARVLIEVVD